MFRLWIVLIGVGMFTVPVSASAARLGGLTVNSALGEPFSAEIGLDANQEELASLKARLAPSEEYADQGIEYTSSISTIHVEVAKRSNNTHVILLSSKQQHRAPFLDLLVQVEWENGKLMREYTTVPNVPVFSQQSTPSDRSPTTTKTQLTEDSVETPQSAAKVTALNEVQSISAVNPELSQKTGTLPSEKAESFELVNPVKPKVKASLTLGESEDLPLTQNLKGSSAHTAESYVTKPGDTLHRIARKLKLKGVSTEQTLLGVYQANKNAFSGGNINRLKLGQRIRIPTYEEFNAISQQEAQMKIRAQSNGWDNHRMNIANQAKELSDADEPPIQQSKKVKADALAELKPAVPVSSQHHVVKLSSASFNIGQSGNVELTQQLTALKDDAIAREKELNQVEEKRQVLENQLSDMQKLLVIKNRMQVETGDAHDSTVSFLVDLLHKYPKLSFLMLVLLAIYVHYKLVVLPAASEILKASRQTFNRQTPSLD